VSIILETLEGHSITEAIGVEDYIQIAFGDEVGISIYNDFHFDPKIDLSQLVGRTLDHASQNEKCITFRFSDPVILVVDLSSEASHGPEIMEMNRRGEPTVVWN
jgi:hypothetical protein